MGVWLVLQGMGLLLAHAGRLVRHGAAPVALGLMLSVVALVMITGSNWLRPGFWVLGQIGVISYFSFLLMVLFLIWTFVQSAVAVPWFMSVLDDGEPDTRSPQFAQRIMRYFAFSLVLTVFFSFASYFASVIGVMVLEALGIGRFFVVRFTVSLAVQFAATYLILRMALILPSAALGGEMSLSESWMRTGTTNVAVMELVLTLVMLTAALDLLVTSLPLGWIGGLVAAIAQAVFNFLIGLGAMAALYRRVD